MSMHQDLIQECEADLRAGHVQTAAKRLIKLNTARVPREYRLPLANLCRRAGLVSTGMKLLSKIIHPRKGAQTSEATSGELAEYGVLLHRNGSTNEALATLTKVNVEKVPEALLYTAFCHFNHWDGMRAIPCLDQYLKADLAPYQRFIGQVNLAAAHVDAHNWTSALELLEANIAIARENAYTRLQGNCHELRGQVYVNKGDLGKAREELQAASTLLGANSAVDNLFVKKWLAVITSLETKSREPIEGFRKEALQRRDWESLREADRFSLKVEFDQERFEHLVFGSPFPAYRERLLSDFGREPSGESYVFGDKQGPCLDLSNCRLLESGEELLNPGKKSHQLLEALLRDFYRPMRVGGLFAELFPGEHFDIFSSPDRIHQILRRTRLTLSDKGLPVEIEELAGNYSLEVIAGFSFQIPLKRSPVSGHHVEYAKLVEVFQPGQEFSAKEARALLGMPRSSFQVLSAWAVETGKLERRGPKNMARYRLPQGKLQNGDHGANAA